MSETIIQNNTNFDTTNNNIIAFIPWFQGHKGLSNNFDSWTLRILTNGRILFNKTTYASGGKVKLNKAEQNTISHIGSLTFEVGGGADAVKIIYEYI